MRIYLTGFMGAGKTTVGEGLAAILEYRPIDLDREIEARAGLGISEIFARYGENRFRDLEHLCLQETAQWDDTVIATGGGTITFKRNLALIRRLGVSVWLNPSFATIVDTLEECGSLPVASS